MTVAVSPFAYAPGTSWLHRRSAVTKLVWLLAGLAFSLVAYQPAPLLLVAGGACLLGISAEAGGAVWRAMRILGPLAASIVVLQVAAPSTCPGGCIEVARVGPAVVTAEALARGVSFVSRLLAMESVAVILLVTTRPSDLFGALRRLNVPHPVALMLATTLQLVPVLQRELGIVLDAQRARGLRAAGIRAVIPALLPVFVAGFERVSRLAISMEVRGYGSAARTSFRTDAFGQTDRLLAWSGLIAGIAGVVAGVVLWGPGSVAPLVVPGWIALGIVGAAAASFAGLVGAAVVSLARA